MMAGDRLKTAFQSRSHIYSLGNMLGLGKMRTRAEFPVENGVPNTLVSEIRRKKCQVHKLRSETIPMAASAAAPLLLP